MYSSIIIILHIIFYLYCSTVITYICYTGKLVSSLLLQSEARMKSCDWILVLLAASHETPHIFRSMYFVYMLSVLILLHHFSSTRLFWCKSYVKRYVRLTFFSAEQVTVKILWFFFASAQCEFLSFYVFFSVTYLTKVLKAARIFLTFTKFIWSAELSCFRVVGCNTLVYNVSIINYVVCSYITTWYFYSKHRVSVYMPTTDVNANYILYHLIKCLQILW